MEKITNKKQVHQITTGATESRTELPFMKFLHAPIEAMPHRLLNELKATRIKYIKSKNCLKSI